MIPFCVILTKASVKITENTTNDTLELELEGTEHSVSSNQPITFRIKGAHELIMALKEIYKIKLGPIPTKWRHHDVPHTITAPSTIKKRKKSPIPNAPVQKPSALDLPNEKKLHYGHMVQHQSSANPTTTPTSQFPDTMNVGILLPSTASPGGKITHGGFAPP